ncbi:MAG: galactokinase [Oscillospiraceae bacterium]|jgi:galactokinase|nr:galactokinase [Oscillospiraceae bacterium]
MREDRLATQIRYLLSSRGADELMTLYGAQDGEPLRQMQRYEKLLKWHGALFPQDEGFAWFFSAPGRTEICGNHTDHNLGKVLAAAVNLDTVAAVTPTQDGIIRACSEGYPAVQVDTADLAPRKEEEGTPAAIVRGTAARMRELGLRVGGFHAAITSSVLHGSGLSSSAAFEVLIAAILDGLYNDWGLDGITRAQIAQYAENAYFGKPCGLMDQMASSVGGLVAIDFQRQQPQVRAMQYDFGARGYDLCVVSPGGDHGDLTEHYAAIPREMRDVAAFFGEKSLRQVHPEQVEQDIAALRERVSDRAVLRALHYFDENRRVDAQVDALKRDDLPTFLRLAVASGYSSWMLLQNVWAEPYRQPLSVALALSERLLGEAGGAFRVHGGGFAGTMLAFVPHALRQTYVARMQAAFGDKACTVLHTRAQGAAVLRPPQ